MEEIKFYHQNGQYGYLSNFSRHPITLKGNVWKTTEHYFQAQKFIGTKHESEIRKAASPNEAARMGRSRKRPLRKNWEQIKDNIMYEALYAKFTQHSKLKKALLDTLSVYYKYSMTKCGFSKVQILGTYEDYQNLYTQYQRIVELLESQYINKKLRIYFKNVKMILIKIINKFDNGSFWKEMIQVEKCDSGHLESFSGWLTQFFYNETRYEFQNMARHIAKVEYKETITQDEFVLFSGLFESIVEDDYLIPQFGYVICKK